MSPTRSLSCHAPLPRSLVLSTPASHNSDTSHSSSSASECDERDDRGMNESRDRYRAPSPKTELEGVSDIFTRIAKLLDIAIFFLSALAVSVGTLVIYSFGYESYPTPTTALAPPCHVLSGTNMIVPCGIAADIGRLVAPISTHASEALTQEWLEPLSSPSAVAGSFSLRIIEELQVLQDEWWERGHYLVRLGRHVSMSLKRYTTNMQQRYTELWVAAATEALELDKLAQWVHSCGHSHSRSQKLYLLISCWLFPRPNGDLVLQRIARLYGHLQANKPGDELLSNRLHHLLEVSHTARRSMALILEKIALQYSDTEILANAQQTHAGLFHAMRHMTVGTLVQNAAATCVKLKVSVEDAMYTSLKSHIRQEMSEVLCGKQPCFTVPSKPTHQLVLSRNISLSDLSQSSVLLQLQELYNRWLNNILSLHAYVNESMLKECAIAWAWETLGHCHIDTVSCLPLPSNYANQFSTSPESRSKPPIAFHDDVNTSCNTNPNLGCDSHPLSLIRWYHSMQLKTSAVIKPDTPHWPSILDKRRSRMSKERVDLHDYKRKLIDHLNDWNHVMAEVINQ